MQFYNRDKIYLLDHSRNELIGFIQNLGLEKYRAQQVFRGIYIQLLPDFKHLTTISKKLREQLDSTAILRSLKLIKTKKSPLDHTVKFLWQLADGKSIESVIIYEGKRITFCISSQVGCALDCKFCATGRMGFLRNLTAGEIVEQVILMKQNTQNLTTNIVFMGMGEPLLNTKNVLKACDIISDPEGLAFARKKITISTSGIIPGIRKLADIKAPFSLAISLNTVFEETRRELMPISKKYPLEKLLPAIGYYTSRTKRRITFEYILFAGLNDTIRDAQQLLKFTTGIPCKINLIPCNIDDPNFPPPAPEKLRWFHEYLNKHNRTVTTRLRKGWDIQAACGQLNAHYAQGTGVKIPHRSNI